MMQEYILEDRACMKNIQKLYLILWTMAVVSLYFQLINKVFAQFSLRQGNSLAWNTYFSTLMYH